GHGAVRQRQGRRWPGRVPAHRGRGREARHEGELTVAGPVKREQVTALYAALRAANPEPKSELEFSTPFELLVAVILSAQATDRSVNIATRRLFPVANTPEAILALGIEGLSPYIRHIG